MDKDGIALGNGAAIDDGETRMAQHDRADPEHIGVNFHDHWHGRGPGMTRAENLSRHHGKHLRHSHLFGLETVVPVKNRTGEANNDHAGTDAYQYGPAVAGKRSRSTQREGPLGPFR